jgi:hypothetical protein
VLDEGNYAVWFKTPFGQGMGMISLAGGRVSGQDSCFTYSGTYEQAGDNRFEANIRITRDRDGVPAVFGVDEVELTLVGSVAGSTATCTGTAAQAPGLDFQATLIRSRQSAAPTPDIDWPTPKFNPAAFPKPKSR